MAVSSGRFPCRPLTCWSSRLLRKLASGVVGGRGVGDGGGGIGTFIFCASLLFPSGTVPDVSSGSGKLLSDF